MKSFSLKNTVVAKAKAKNFESFLNECVNEGIILSDISQTENGYNFSMSFKNYRRILPIAFKTGVRTKIVRKKGALYFAYKRRTRYGFFGGAIIAILLFVYLTSCIWVVDVVGNKETPTKEILKVLKKNDIGVGKLRYGKNISKIKNSALIDLDTLSWLWVTIDGTRAVVEVREKGSSPEIIDKTGAYNLVASYPGVIVDMQVRDGRKAVERNMVVSEGQMLVSGVCSSVYRPDRYVRANGTVTARTWRTLSAEYHHTETQKIKTGETKKKYTLGIMNKDIKLYLNKKPDFKNYVKEEKKTRLRIFKDIYLPITFTTDVFYEIIIKENKLDDDTVVSQAVESLTNQLERARADGARTVERTYSYETLPNGNLYVSVMLMSEENIAKTVKVDIQTAKEDVSGKSN